MVDTNALIRFFGTPKDMKAELQKRNERTLSTGDVKSRMVTVREQLTLLDRDVAELYGVKTREVNQAVRNNPEKFPEGYVFRLNDAEFSDWRSKILTSDLPQETKDSVRKGLRYAPYAFTERGLYMLATILKGELATKTTIAIIETYAKVRGLKRELVELHNEKDRKKQTEKINHFGETLADIVMPDLGTVETESSLEINFFIGKIKHTVRRIKKQ